MRFFVFLSLLLCSCAFQQVAPLEDRARALSIVDQAVGLAREGDLERAEVQYKLSMEVYPTVEAIDGLGCVAFLRGDLSIAEKFFRQAIALDPEYAEAVGNLALLLESQGKFSEAGTTYRSALSIAPQDARIRNNYAVFLYANQGNPQRARQEILKAEALLSHPMIFQNQNVIRGE